jgi:transposase
MNKRIIIKAHLPKEEVEARYRKAKDCVERSHWQIIWLLMQDKTTQEVMEYTGYSLAWIRTVAHRYNQLGPQALGDGRRENPGGKAILSAAQQAALSRALDEPPADGGAWTGPKVTAWIEEQTGRPVHPQRGWAYLKRLGHGKRTTRAT